MNKARIKEKLLFETENNDETNKSKGNSSTNVGESLTLYPGNTFLT